jgi:predicted phage tail protein
MIEIPPKSLVDHAAIEAAQARLNDAAAKLEAAKASVISANADVSRAWDESVKQMAGGGDAMAGAEAHAAAVARREFAANLVDAAEKNLAGEREIFERARIMGHVPLLKKGRELRLAAARAHDAAQRAAAEADALAAQGARLLAAAHSAGLRHFSLIGMSRGAQSEAAELEFLTAEAGAAKAFWGTEL